MKKLLLIGLLGLISLAFAKSVEVGMTEAKLIELKGAPQSKAAAGKKAIYRWPDMEVTLVDGKVDQIRLRDRAKEQQNAAERDSQTTRQNSGESEDSAQKTDVTRKNLNVKTIREVETDMLSFVDKPFYVEGTIEVSSHYNYGYHDSEQTHFSFEIRDGRKTCYAYMERTKAAEIRRRLLNAGMALPGKFRLVLLRNRFQKDATTVFAELLEYTPKL